MPAIDQFYLSIVTSLAVRDFIRTFNVEAKIKWPNDIYVNRKKICGILIQNTLVGKLIQYCIVGIGININQMIFDPSLPNPTSLRLETTTIYKLPTIRTKLFDIFESYYIDLINQKKKHLYENYVSELYQKDNVHSYEITKGEIVAGIIRDVNNSGQLALEVNNEIKHFSLKDFKYL